MFNENSVIVRVWFTAVLGGSYKYSQVPNLSNLREVVGQKLIELGYDIENENAWWINNVLEGWTWREMTSLETFMKD